MNLPLYVKKIFTTIEQTNNEVYIVGGAVRDYLLGIKNSDYDFATNLNVEQIMKLFKDYKIINNNSQKHNTVTIYIDHNKVEISTYKGANLKEDLANRDLTINAIAYHYQQGLIDYWGGITDLKKKILRVPNNAKSIIEADYLRILRVLRFASNLGFMIDLDTKNYLFEFKEMLKTISVERIFSELKQILIGKNVLNILLEYKEILGVIIPDLIPCFNFNQNSVYHLHDVYTHTAYVVSYCPNNYLIRLAALFHDIGKPKTYTEEIKDNLVIGHFYGHPKISMEIAKKNLKRLKCSNIDTSKILYLVLHHDFYVKDKQDVKKLLVMAPNSDLAVFNQLVDLHLADRIDHVNCVVENHDEIKKIANLIISNKEVINLKGLAINGNDLLSLGFKAQEIKKVLNEVLEAVVTDKLVNEKDIIIKHIQQNMKGV